MEFWLSLGLGLLGVALAVTAYRVSALQRRLRAQAGKHHAVLDRLQESENRLRAIIESEPECVKLQAEDGTVLEVNPAGLLLIDAVAQADIVGKSIYPTVAPEFQAFYKEQVRRVFAGEAVVFEFRAITLRGRQAWLETHAVPLRDARGRIIALLGVTRDITDRKRVEAQARRHHAELAHVARLSTMGEMATGIAHELNQPLAAISNFARGCIRRLRAGGADMDEIMGVLDDISRQAERAGEVLRHIREFTRKGGANPSTVQINQLVSAVARLTELEIAGLGATLVLDLDVDLPPVTVDPIMVEQVLCNLVRNAAEAMASHECAERRIVVTTRCDAEGQVEVATRDSGPGMPPEVAARAFDQFFTTKPAGTGMGLSISRSIIEAYGGRLWVETEPGRGAVFRFSLNAAAQAMRA